MTTQSPSGSPPKASGTSTKPDICLPLTRVKTIMKSSPDVEAVSQESLFLITKATELFIVYLIRQAMRSGENDKEVKYSDLAAAVKRKESMLFLQDILPKKIKYKEYLAMMRKDKKTDDDIL